VTAAPGGASCTTGGIGGAQACKVSGLINGQNYTFTARLTNSAFAGSVSPPSNSVTPGPQCRLLTLLAEGSGVLTAAPPSSPGCPASFFAPGASIVLAAAPAAGFTVASWSGSLPGPTELQWQWDYTMPVSAAAQTATFAQCYSLSVEMLGGATVDSDHPRATTASVVLGQADFVTGAVQFAATAPFGLANTCGMAIDSQRNLYVVQSGSHRVSVCAPDALIPFRVLGQDNFNIGATNRGLGYDAARADTFFQPTGLTLDDQDGLYVADYRNNRVLFFEPGADSATRVYGQSGSFTSNGANHAATYSLPGGIASAESLQKPIAAVLAPSRDGLFILDQGNSPILYYPATSTTATRVIGQTDFTGSNFGVGPDKMHGPSGLTVDASGGLWVGDSRNHRVLYFPAGSSVATRVLGQPDFTSNVQNSPSGVPSAASFSYPCGVALVDDDESLLVMDNANNRALYFKSGATEATTVWGQAGDFTTNQLNLGSADGSPSADSLNGPYFPPLVDQAERLLVSDWLNNRVLMYDPIPV